MEGKTRPPYRPAYRADAIRAMRAGRGPDELGRELGDSGQTLRNWLKHADLDEGVRKDGLTSDERLELSRLRREVHPCSGRRKRSQKGPRSTSPGKPTRSGSRVRVHRPRKDRLPGQAALRHVQGFHERLLRLSLAFARRLREAGIGPRWAAGAIPTTVPSPRASGRPSIASCSTTPSSSTELRPGSPSSTTSRAGSTSGGGIRRSPCCLPSSASAGGVRRTIRR